MTAGPRKRWPRARSAAEPIVFNNDLEESRCPVICGKIKALVFKERQGILALCKQLSSQVSTVF